MAWKRPGRHAIVDRLSRSYSRVPILTLRACCEVDRDHIIDKPYRRDELLGRFVLLWNSGCRSPHANPESLGHEDWSHLPLAGRDARGRSREDARGIFKRGLTSWPQE